MRGRSWSGILLTVLAMGCGDSGTAPRCITGSTNACLCVGGQMGVQVCAADGTYGACVCAVPGTDAGADGAATGDVTSPGDVPATPDGAQPVDATTSDVGPGADVPSPPVDATPSDVSVPPPDVPTSMDVPSPPPDVPSACGSLPMTAASPTRVTFVRSLHETSFLGFTPNGRLAVVSTSAYGNGLTMYTSDGFSAPFSTASTGGAQIRFLSDMQAIVAPEPRDTPPYFIRSLSPTNNTTVTPSQSVLPSVLGLDRAGGIYYTNGDRLFRTTVGTTGPGVFLVNGLPTVNAGVINADESALFLVGGTSTQITGIYRIALTRDATGNVFASAPTMYYPVDALGNPDGLAIDVCGNLYTSDRSTNVMWRIPAGAVPGTASGRPTVVASSPIGRPVFSVGPGFTSTRLYWMNNTYSGGIFSSQGPYYVDVGVPGVRQ